MGTTRTHIRTSIDIFTSLITDHDFTRLVKYTIHPIFFLVCLTDLWITFVQNCIPTYCCVSCNVLPKRKVNLDQSSTPWVIWHQSGLSAVLLYTLLSCRTLCFLHQEGYLVGINRYQIVHKAENNLPLIKMLLEIWTILY